MITSPFLFAQEEQDSELKQAADTLNDKIENLIADFDDEINTNLGEC